jgi:hypothetical protein
VRRVLNIPESKKIVIGIAMGYPSQDAPAAIFRSNRAPLEEVIRFA